MVNLPNFSTLLLVCVSLTTAFPTDHDPSFSKRNTVIPGSPPPPAVQKNPVSPPVSNQAGGTAVKKPTAQQPPPNVALGQPGIQRAAPAPGSAAPAPGSAAKTDTNGVIFLPPPKKPALCPIPPAPVKPANRKQDVNTAANPAQVIINTAGAAPAGPAAAPAAKTGARPNTASVGRPAAVPAAKTGPPGNTVSPGKSPAVSSTQKAAQNARRSLQRSNTSSLGKRAPLEVDKMSDDQAPPRPPPANYVPASSRPLRQHDTGHRGHTQYGIPPQAPPAVPDRYRSPSPVYPQDNAPQPQRHGRFELFEPESAVCRVPFVTSDFYCSELNPPPHRTTYIRVPEQILRDAFIDLGACLENPNPRVVYLVGPISAITQQDSTSRVRKIITTGPLVMQYKCLVHEGRPYAEAYSVAHTEGGRERCLTPEELDDLERPRGRRPWRQ